MRRTGEEPVSYEEAARRVARALLASSVPKRQSGIADIIWPDHTMSRQGAALAAGVFTRRLQSDAVIATTGHGFVAGARAKRVAA